MIGEEAKRYVFIRSQIMYHIILFVTFFGAVQVQPWLLVQAQSYLAQYAWAQSILSWILVYLLAIYIFPAVAFMIVKAILDKN